MWAIITLSYSSKVLIIWEKCCRKYWNSRFLCNPLIFFSNTANFFNLSKKIFIIPWKSEKSHSCCYKKEQIHLFHHHFRSRHRLIINTRLILALFLNFLIHTTKTLRYFQLWHLANMAKYSTVLVLLVSIIVNFGNTVMWINRNEFIYR